MHRTIAVGLALAGSAAWGQDGRQIPAHEKVDQQRVDEAIRKGCLWLLSQGSARIQEPFEHAKRHQATGRQSYLELVVLTLAHSGFYPQEDPQMAELLEAMLKKELETTYTVSLQAMALQKIDARKHQWRLAQCAQFLVDNQAENGQWDYGEKVDVSQFQAPEPPAEPEPKIGTDGTAPKPAKTEKPADAPLPKIPVAKRRAGPPSGDNSNSQYAALGLRACLEAGIVIGKEVLLRARTWWIESQNSDGGWGYNAHGRHPDPPSAAPGKVSNDSYGSMTAGAVGGTCIYDYYLNMDYRADTSLLRGMEWLTRNYDVRNNPKKELWRYLYFLYGLERVGMIFGTEQFGTREWYPDGALHLLDTQKPDGSWDFGPSSKDGGIAGTCFAILFLRRGTPPLPKISTGGSANK